MKVVMKNDLSKKFSKGTIIIHWVSTLLILALFTLGITMEDLKISEKMDLVKIHALLGIVLLVLTIVRSYLFFRSPRPPHLKTGSKFNDKLAVYIHNLFYILLLVISVSGLATMIIGGYGDALSLGDVALVKEHADIPPLKAHGTLAFIMMGLVVMHVVGVLKHYVFTKENTLKRIF